MGETIDLLGPVGGKDKGSFEGLVRLREERLEKGFEAPQSLGSSQYLTGRDYTFVSFQYFPRLEV